MGALSCVVPRGTGRWSQGREEEERGGAPTRRQTKANGASAPTPSQYRPRFTVPRVGAGLAVPASDRGVGGPWQRAAAAGATVTGTTAATVAVAAGTTVTASGTPHPPPPPDTQHTGRCRQWGATGPQSARSGGVSVRVRAPVGHRGRASSHMGSSSDSGRRPPCPPGPSSRRPSHRLATTGPPPPPASDGARHLRRTRAGDRPC